MKSAFLGLTVEIAQNSLEGHYRREVAVFGWFIWHEFIYAVTERVGVDAGRFTCTELRTGRACSVAEMTPAEACKTMIEKLDALGLEKVQAIVAQAADVSTLPTLAQMREERRKEERREGI